MNGRISCDIENAKVHLHGVGRCEEEWNRPYIGIACPWTEHFPGHNHLDRLAKAVSDGVYMGGGTPCIFGTIAIADCTVGTGRMPNVSLASRDLICDSVEAMAYGSKFDALVLLAGCDKIVPAMLMAAARLNIPTIVVTGGPMLPGRHKGYSVDISTRGRIDEEYRAGRLTQKDVNEKYRYVCPGSGSCAGLFTANSMACITEIIGMGLPGNGTIPAVYAERTILAKNAGIQIMELYHRNICPRDIMTRDAFENAIRVDMMMGGSTNTILHMLAIAHEAGVQLSIDDFAEFSKKTPEICKITPCGEHFMTDLYEAGGVEALMKRAEEAGLLHGNCLTVTGRTVAENIVDVQVLNEDVIRPLSNPYTQTGGLNVLRGNIAPECSIVKSAAVPPHMWKFRGVANCYESEQDAWRGLEAGEMRPGQVIVVRNEGPKGFPGMPEMVDLIHAIQAAGLGESVAFITDGRFSGVTFGACIGYICPEAAVGGPIALIENGDMIEYDIDAGTINVLVDDEVLTERKACWKAPEPRIKSGFLGKYASLVGPSSKGALVRGIYDTDED